MGFKTTRKPFSFFLYHANFTAILPLLDFIIEKPRRSGPFFPRPLAVIPQAKIDCICPFHQPFRVEFSAGPVGRIELSKVRARDISPHGKK